MRACRFNAVDLQCNTISVYVLGETAVAAGRTQTREGARCRRLARRRGKAKAQVALGNTQLKVYYALLSHPGTRYEDLGADYYDRRNIRRQARTHIQRLESLGFRVTLTPLPDLTGCPEAS